MVGICTHCTYRIGQEGKQNSFTFSVFTRRGAANKIRKFNSIHAPFPKCKWAFTDFKEKKRWRPNKTFTQQILYSISSSCHLCPGHNSFSAKKCLERKLVPPIDDGRQQAVSSSLPGACLTPARTRNRKTASE